MGTITSSPHRVEDLVREVEKLRSFRENDQRLMRKQAEALKMWQEAFQDKEHTSARCRAAKVRIALKETDRVLG